MRVMGDRVTSHRGYENPMDIYTDASKKRDNIGYSCVACDDIYILDEGYKSTIEIGIFQVEMLAVAEVLRCIKHQGDREREYNIWSDSKGVVMSLNGYKANSRLMGETILELKKLRVMTNIKKGWVQAHSGITGNVIADLLALNGAEEALLLAYCSPCQAIDYGSIKRRIKIIIMNEWQERWDYLPTCMVSHLFRSTRVGLSGCAP